MFKHTDLWSSQPWSEKVHSLCYGKHSIRKLNWQHYCKQVTTKGSALNGGISIFINPLPRLRKVRKNAWNGNCTHEHSSYGYL